MDTVTFGLCLFLWYIVLLPILSYYLYLYHKNIDDQFIRPRNPRLSLLSNYSLMILLFIIAPIQWAEIIYFESYNFGALREYLFVIRVVWEQLSMWLRLIRYWHCWYKYQYQKHCALSVYIKAINIDAIKSNYFVKYRNTFGNLSFLLSSVFIVWLIEVILCILMIVLLNTESSYTIITAIAFFFYLTQCIVFILLSITMNKTRDTLHIRNEVLYESMAALCSCLVLCIIFIFSNNNMMSNKYFVSVIMFILPGFIVYPSMISITSCWVHHKMNKQRQLTYLKQKELELERYSNNVSTISSLNHGMRFVPSNVPSHSITMTDTTNTNTKRRDTMSMCEESRNHTDSMTLNLKLDSIDDKIDPRLKSIATSHTVSSSKSPKSKTPLLLDKLLSNKDGFELFAEHLINSYAIENLLFLIEVEKFKKNCKSKYGKKLCIDQRKLPRSLPQSIGLKAHNKNIKLQYCYLYHKYIDSVKADFSINIASRNRLICRMLYNDFYDASHGLIDGEYDDTEFDSRSANISPKVRTPRSPTINSAKNNKVKALKRRGSFPNTTIIGFRQKDAANSNEEEKVSLKEKEIESISILPPLRTNKNNNNLSVSSYIKLTSSRASTTITATPSAHYPPTLTININEHSFDTRSDQLTIYEAQCELTDNEETPAPPTFLTPQITPQGTPLPDVDLTEENTENFKAKSATLQPILLNCHGLEPPISPLSLSHNKKEDEDEAPKNLTVNKILSIDSTASSTASIMTEESSTKTVIKSISSSFELMHNKHQQWNSSSFEGDIGLNNMDTPIPNELKKEKKICFKHRPNLQKRSSASLMHLANKVSRNALNARVDEMMFLMNNQDCDNILSKYVDDINDVFDIIDALDNCLKDVFANLRDSFGRFVFSDSYQRWANDEDQF